MTPIKILLFIRALDVGGSQSQVALLARGLARRSHTVKVIVLYPTTGVDESLSKYGVCVVSLAKRGRWDVIGPLWRFWRLLLSERADVLYSFLSAQTVLSALLLPPWIPTRLVFGIRAAGMQLDRYDALSSLLHRAEALLSWRADLLIANAEAGRLSAIRRGMSARRMTVVPNGIDAECMRPDAAKGHEVRRALGLSESSFIIGIVARLDPMKDHETFLAAAAMFAGKYPDARFVCVGDGAASYRAHLRTRARAHGLESRVLWVGERSDVRGVYDAFDIATLSSSFGEAFPNVIGEAMACGVPVVATDVGDARTIVGTLGEIVLPQSPDLLCAGWERLRQRLATEPGLRAAARDAIVRRYAVDKLVNQTEELLTALCGSRSVQQTADEPV